MQVLKFGGSSVANATNMNKVIAIVRKAIANDRTVVVASAISGATDALLLIGKTAKAGDENYLNLIDTLQQKHTAIIEELIPAEESEVIKIKCNALFNQLREICKGVYLLKELTELSQDHLVSFGEMLSTNIISAKLKSLNISHQWKDSRDLIKTEAQAGKNVVIDNLTTNNIWEYFNNDQHKLYIMPGFIASDMAGRTTTLGRGGSDYTASIIAVGTQARRLEIWTDVCGMMTADPRIVPDAHPIRNISYKEALELSHFGAKVVYPPTIQPVVKQGIPIYVKNTFAPDDFGTLIERNPPQGQEKIRGISSSNKIALLSMEGSGMVGIPGYSSKLFDVLSKNNVNIILITQASSVHTMCIAIAEDDADKAKKAADELFAYEISLGKVDPLRVEKGFSIISLVGDDMKNQSGASGKMFEALGREGINIRAIAQGSSEKNVSAVLHTEDVNDAIRAIHTEFFSNSANRVNLFIAGYGTVSKALVSIIFAQRKSIEARLGKEIVICGLCNSRNYLLNRNGIEENFNLQEGEKNTDNRYISEICKLKLSNSIFVDCTANRNIASLYVDMFRNKFSVVTCNKIANSLSYESYRELFATARLEKVQYKYETTVCAALPVLETILQLVNCGDTIYRIEGILSGTLNFLFSNYNGETPFATLVKEAAEKGYAEPDPRLDLAGTDVFRKFLISSRQGGFPIESSDVDFQGFIPEEIMCKEQTDFPAYAEEFYAKLLAYEPQLKEQYTKAAAKGEKLRFIASLDAKECNGNGKPKCTISLKSIGAEHPFYTLEGTDNAVIIESDYYPNAIVIKGAGAGARQTAGGVLNDILSL
ncbi:MAG: bifunctional aspartate kinase/homoserine dehydrogenase I [Bacteroidales bacterium]|nr:bifunctional aspartate kinase/homoserine dehydrogenase I [Bacteroidales bacterium]